MHVHKIQTVKQVLLALRGLAGIPLVRQKPTVSVPHPPQFLLFVMKHAQLIVIVRQVLLALRGLAGILDVLVKQIVHVLL